MLAGEQERKPMTETKPAQKTSKIVRLRGTLEAQMVKCSKPNCKCAKGNLHGPYFVLRVRVGENRWSKYIKKRDVLAVKLAIAADKQGRRRARREWDEAMKVLRGFRYRLSRG
jgi:hypothetical protein